MKKSLILRIILLMVAIIFILNFLFHIFYFQIFQEKTRTITNSEKQEIIELFNQSMNLKDYQIKFENVYNIKDREFAQVEIVKNNSKKNYLVDLKYKKIIRK